MLVLAFDMRLETFRELAEQLLHFLLFGLIVVRLEFICVIESSVDLNKFLAQIPGVDSVLLLDRTVEEVYNILNNGFVDFAVLLGEEKRANKFVLEGFKSGLNLEDLHQFI
jgi:hypothetical protein